MTILGIDAAWTLRQPTGIALVTRAASRWEVVAVAPSYASFIRCASGSRPDWSVSKFVGAKPDMSEILAAAQALAGRNVDLVAIDMPVATRPITGRREADNLISKCFGKFGCAAHTPSAKRPGAYGASIAKELSDLGFPVATSSDNVGTLNRTIEVYPHPALLSLLAADYRVAYKVSKSKRYWPNASVRRRIEYLLEQYRRIFEALSVEFDLDFSLPNAADVASLSSLKRYEDALDAIICAWVGVQYVRGRATAYGDETAAVWVPQRKYAV